MRCAKDNAYLQAFLIRRRDFSFSSLKGGITTVTQDDRLWEQKRSDTIRRLKNQGVRIDRYEPTKAIQLLRKWTQSLANESIEGLEK